MLKKFYNSLTDEGFQRALKKVFGWFVYKVNYKLGRTNPISQRRIFLSEKLDKSFDSIIKYGPFRGFKFNNSFCWFGVSDRASMLLGLYEQEVLLSFKQIPKKYKYFINIGGADGYYGVGVIVGKLFKKSYCYEISEQGQKTIEANAKINDVTDKIEIRGKAVSNFHEDFSQNEADKSVLLVDIEGGEFELFNSEVLKKFKNSVILIELHEWLFPDGKDRLDRLKNEVEQHFKITTLTTMGRDLSVFKELREMNDTDRWLICSEGRHKLMSWWRLDPK